MELEYPLNFSFGIRKRMYCICDVKNLLSVYLLQSVANAAISLVYRRAI